MPRLEASSSSTKSGAAPRHTTDYRSLGLSPNTFIAKSVRDPYLPRITTNSPSSPISSPALKTPRSPSKNSNPTSYSCENSSMALQIVAMASKSPNSPEFPSRSSTAPKNSSIRSKKRAARNSLTRPNPTKSHLPTRRRRRRRSRRSDRYLATPHNTRHRSIIQNCNRLSPISELLHSTRRRQFKHSIFSINCRKRLKTSKIALASYYLGGECPTIE